MKIYCFRCKGTTKNANTQIFLGKNVFLYKKCAYFILRPDSRLLILGSRFLSPYTNFPFNVAALASSIFTITNSPIFLPSRGKTTVLYCEVLPYISSLLRFE